MHRVLLVDSQPIVRVGVKALLDAQTNLTVVGESGSAQDAIDLTQSLKPNIVIMDVNLQGGSGVETCRQIIAINPSTKVIVFTSSAESGIIFETIMAGACGYLLKQLGGDELIKAIHKVGRGESLLDSEITGKVMEKMRSLAKGGPTDNLNNQEKKLLGLIAQGKTNREIGEILLLSEKTIKNYLSTVFSKLGLSNRAEAAAYAVRNLYLLIILFIQGMLTTS